PCRQGPAGAGAGQPRLPGHGPVLGGPGGRPTAGAGRDAEYGGRRLAGRAATGRLAGGGSATRAAPALNPETSGRCAAHHLEPSPEQARRANLHSILTSLFGAGVAFRCEGEHAAGPPVKTFVLSTVGTTPS